MELQLSPYRHPSGAFSLLVPDGWEKVEDTEGVALIAVEPARGPWFRANLVVTIGELAPPAELVQWQEETLELLRQTLSEFVLIDIEETELAGRPARRTLAHYRAETEQSVNAVVMEQWAVVEGALGYTLTASVAALEHADFADAFRQLASEFRPDPEFQP